MNTCAHTLMYTDTHVLVKLSIHAEGTQMCAHTHTRTVTCGNTRKNTPSHARVHRQGSRTLQTYTCAHRLARPYTLTDTRSQTTVVTFHSRQAGTGAHRAHVPPSARGRTRVRTRSTVFQGEGAVQRSVASHRSELPWHRGCVGKRFGKDLQETGRAGRESCQVPLETQSDRAQSPALVKSPRGESSFTGPAPLPHQCPPESTRFWLCNLRGPRQDKNESLIVHK